MNYNELLENSYQHEKINSCSGEDISKAEFLASSVFNLTTYSSSMDELLVSKFIKVCEAITNEETFKYIEDEQNYVWYIICVNMEFFKERIDWGTSIRGAWWSYVQLPLDSCGIWNGEEQIELLLFPTDTCFKEFMKAVVKFYRS